MSESNKQTPQDAPQWIPYQPPQPGGAERAWTTAKWAVPLGLLVLLVGGGALLYYAPRLGLDELQPLRARAERLIGAVLAPNASAPARLPTTLPDVRDDDSAQAATAQAGPAGASRLTVRSQPTGATVLVDGDSVGVTPLQGHTLPAGAYIVSVRKPGFAAADTVMILRATEAPSYMAALQPMNAPRTPASALTAEAPAGGFEEGTPEDEPSASEASPPSSSSSPASEAPPEAPPEPTTGAVRVTSTPAGAQVQLDGAPVGVTPLTLRDIAAGRHTVTLHQAGYDTLVTSVQVTPGAVRTLRETLTTAQGTLRVLPRPWGTIYVDGALRERNADVWFEARLPAGAHEVRVVHPALGERTRMVEVTGGGTVSVVIDLMQPPENEGVAGTSAPDSSGRRP